MIIVWDKVINVEVEDIVDDLRRETGLLKDKIEAGDNIMVTCIKHSRGQERNPSMGILKKDVIRGDKTYSAGMVNCFTCGYTADIVTFVSDVFDVELYEGFRWLIRRYKHGEGIRKIDVNLDRDKTDVVLNMDIARAYHNDYCNSERAWFYLQGRRGIAGLVANEFLVGYSRETDNLVFPILDRKGRLRGFQDRSIEGKRFYNERGGNKGELVYGANKVRGKRVWVVEGIIDCLTLWSLGEEAVAIMGSDITEKQVREVLLTGVERVVLAFDNDEAGEKAKRKAREKFKGKGVRIGELKYKTVFKDINDVYNSGGDMKENLKIVWKNI